MLWILLVVFVCLVIWMAVDWYTKNEEFERIPGPKGIYLIGNAFDFLMESGNIFVYFRYLANKYKNIYKGKLGPVKFVAILDPQDIEAVIYGSKNINKSFIYNIMKPWLHEGLILSNGNRWRNRRKLLTPAFHFNVLMNYKPIFDEHSKTLVKNLSSEVDKTKTDIYIFLSDCTLSAICETAMGTKLDPKNESNRRYMDGTKELGELLMYRGFRFWLFNDFIFSISKAGRKQKLTINALSKFRDNLVNKKRQDGSQTFILDKTYEDKDDYNVVYKRKRMCMLDILLQAEKEGHIDGEGINEEVDTFMFEGHDTTATCLQFTLMLLANNAEAQEKVYEECAQIFGTSDRAATMDDLGKMKYLDCCIKESLRLYPPVYFFMRTIDNDVKLRDYTLPAGTECGIVLYDTHRRPDQFEKPLEFRPERFLTEPTWHPYAYIPFSAGSRNCIGQKFAMIELKVLLSALVRRYRFLPVTRPQDLKFIVDLLLRVKDPIYVKIERRM